MGREARLKTGEVVGSILGIKLFADTQILRIAVIPAHFLAVAPPDYKGADSIVDFPLADLDQPDAPNTTIMIVLLRLHPGEPMTGAYQFRYHHRDSVSHDDGLDLKRAYHVTPNQEEDPDILIAELAALLPTVGEPTIVGVGQHLDVAAAFDAFKRTRFAIFTPPSTEHEGGCGDR